MTLTTAPVSAAKAAEFRMTPEQLRPAQGPCVDSSLRASLEFTETPFTF